MKVATGKVVSGNVVVEGAALENDETFDVTPDQEAELLHALAEADRGDIIPGQQFLKELRSRLSDVA